MKDVTIGIDIGGTNTKYGFVDRDGNLLGDSSMSTTGYSEIEAYIQATVSAIEKLKAQIPEELNVIGMGIGAPNANYYTGTIEHAPNLPWKGVIPLADLFQQHFDIPVAITNDANAAAIGEMIYGGAKGMKNFAVITLGTGVGSGFVVNGDLVYGHDGFAGEFGHVIAVPDGRMCTCGRRGCIETYCAARGLVLTVQEELAGSPKPSELRHMLPETITPKDIYDAAISGDEIAQKAFWETGRLLGKALANLVAILSPEAIFFFGGVAKAGELILNPTKQYMEKYSLVVFQNKVKLIPSQLPDNDAAILGASALAWKELAK